MDMFDDAFGSAPATTAAQPDPAADFMNREQVSKIFVDMRTLHFLSG
jgi:hypothetical protein